MRIIKTACICLTVAALPLACAITSPASTYTLNIRSALKNERIGSFQAIDGSSFTNKNIIIGQKLSHMPETGILAIIDNGQLGAKTLKIVFAGDDPCTVIVPENIQRWADKGVVCFDTNDKLMASIDQDCIDKQNIINIMFRRF